MGTEGNQTPCLSCREQGLVAAWRLLLMLLAPLLTSCQTGISSPEPACLWRLCRGLSRATLGWDSGGPPAFTPEVASGSPMLLSAQVLFLGKKRGNAEAGQRHPSY